MKQLLCLLLGSLFYISTATFPQNSEWIKNTNSNQTSNFIIPDFLVNDNYRDSTDQYLSHISVDYFGNFVITWFDERNGAQDVYAQRFSVDGTPLGSNFKVNNESITSNNWDLCIASDSIGNIAIAWQDTPRFQIYAQRYSNDGNRLGTNYKVEKENELEHTFYPCISSNNIGEFVLAWIEDSAVRAQRYSSNGNPFGGIIKVSEENKILNSRPSVCVDDIGKFTIVWVQEDGLVAKPYPFEGIELGEYSKIVVDDNANGADHEITTSVSADKNGNFVVTWRSKSWDIYAQRYSSEGYTIGEKFKVNDEITDRSNWPPCIVSEDSNGNFIVMWTQCYENTWDCESMAQRYSSEGQRIGENFIIGGWDIKLWNNRIYVTWGENGDIWAKVLDFNNPVAVKEAVKIPNNHQLSQNYPNPFNPSTTLKYEIPKESYITLKVYDILGREVATLINKQQKAGYYEVSWNAVNNSSGIYFYRLETNTGFTKTMKLVLLK